MIKFKIIRNIAFMGLVLLGTVSCNHADWLETTDKETLTDATMWASEGNADIYLNDCFRDLSAKGNYPDPSIALPVTMMADGIIHHITGGKA
ncbi:MAG TPA: hypothetical protein PLI41_03055 [Bacteroidales bacterium]|nr:hypothetical protein [Bacteroidales bacterium]